MVSDDVLTQCGVFVFPDADSRSLDTIDSTSTAESSLDSRGNEK